MTRKHVHALLPILATCALGAGFALPSAAAVTAAAVVALLAAVVSVVHHAEAIAHRIGEPYGTLVLALLITVIEVALVGQAGERFHRQLPRDDSHSRARVALLAIDARARYATRNAAGPLARARWYQ